MHLLPISGGTIPSSEPAGDARWSGPAAWRAVDDDVTLTFDAGAAGTPETLGWRGSSWQVVGVARHWNTWHFLAVEPAGDPPPACRGLRTSFWRFAGQTNPVGPVFHFEVRGSGNTWRLVRLGFEFDLPATP